jgi:hypothetical protein
MPIASAERDHVKERSAWFLSGRVVAAKPSAELRRRAYEKKMQWRSQRNNAAAALTVAPGPTGSSFPGAVTLSCPSGLPAGAQCLFSPATPIVPGSTSAAVVMSISTPTTARLQGPYNRNPIFLAMWLALPGMVVLCGAARGASRRRRGMLGVIAGMLALLLTSCGGGSNGGGGGGGHQPTKYTVSISDLWFTQSCRHSGPCGLTLTRLVLTRTRPAGYHHLSLSL